nr:hypothetical protein [Actinomycetota bacterium]
MAVTVEVANRSGAEVEEQAASALARSVLETEGVDDAEVGISFVGPEEIRRLKVEHLGKDEV